MTPAEEEVARAMDAEASLHGELALAPGFGAYMRGARAWMFFHLPRLSRNFACELARGLVREAAEGLSERGTVGDPPVVPDELRALWAVPAGLPDGGAS